MSARPIASATLSFGLVSVPIQLFSSSESRATISFNWLHRDCGSRLKQQYVCKKDEQVVERQDMVKGYEFGKGQFVTFTPEELKLLDEQAKEAIEITEFVPAEQVGRNLVNKVYYLGPDKGGARAYRLLSAALKETGLSAVARYSARGKQYLVLIRPEGEGLAMEQLYYADEVRPFSEVPVGETELKPEELTLAVQLIRQAATDSFDAARYEDEVRKRVMEQIERKIQGKEITAAPEEEPQTQIIDLMEALKQSLAKGDAKKEAATAPESSRKPRRKTAGGDA
ncbi:MAG: Ku protein [Gemmatimonadota bacterium]|nr:Ku protein [Gemmatimonadota bacterium]